MALLIAKPWSRKFVHGRLWWILWTWSSKENFGFPKRRLRAWKIPSSCLTLSNWCCRGHPAIHFTFPIRHVSWIISNPATPLLRFSSGHEFSSIVWCYFLLMNFTVIMRYRSKAPFFTSLGKSLGRCWLFTNPSIRLHKECIVANDKNEMKNTQTQWILLCLLGPLHRCIHVKSATVQCPSHSSVKSIV